MFLLREEPAFVFMSKLHNPRVPPEEGNGKLVLSSLYIENPEKGTPKLELTQQYIKHLLLSMI